MRFCAALLFAARFANCFLNMENEQYYAIELDDYATVSFMSGTKPYFGTLPEIERFINALKEECNDDNESFKRTVAAFEEFKNGNSKATHYAAFNDVRLLTPAAVLDSVSYTLPETEWEHMNIYNFLYKMRCAAAKIEHFWLEFEGNFYRAMRVEFTGLEYGSNLFEDLSESWEKIRRGNIWGFPHIIEVKSKIVYNTLAVPEKRFKTEEELRSDIDGFKKDPRPDFSAFCDDIFGDG